MLVKDDMSTNDKGTIRSWKIENPYREYEADPEYWEFKLGENQTVGTLKDLFIQKLEEDHKFGVYKYDKENTRYHKMQLADFGEYPRDDGSYIWQAYTFRNKRLDDYSERYLLKFDQNINGMRGYDPSRRVIFKCSTPSGKKFKLKLLLNGGDPKIYDWASRKANKNVTSLQESLEIMMDAGCKCYLKRKDNGELEEVENIEEAIFSRKIYVKLDKDISPDIEFKERSFEIMDQNQYQSTRKILYIYRKPIPPFSFSIILGALEGAVVISSVQYLMPIVEKFIFQKNVLYPSLTKVASSAFLGAAIGAIIGFGVCNMTRYFTLPLTEEQRGHDRN